MTEGPGHAGAWPACARATYLVQSPGPVEKRRLDVPSPIAAKSPRLTNRLGRLRTDRPRRSELANPRQSLPCGRPPCGQCITTIYPTRTRRAITTCVYLSSRARIHPRSTYRPRPRSLSDPGADLGISSNASRPRTPDHHRQGSLLAIGQYLYDTAVRPVPVQSNGVTRSGRTVLVEGPQTASRHVSVLRFRPLYPMADPFRP